MIKVITYKGKTKTIREWAKEIGLTPEALRNRIHAGWDLTKAITTPPTKNVENRAPSMAGKMITVNGYTKTVREWCRINNISMNLVRLRLKAGWSIEEAVALPPSSNYKRTGQRYEWKGESLTVPQWSEIVGIDKATIRARIKAGWDIEKTLTIHPNRSKKTS